MAPPSLMDDRGRIAKIQQLPGNNLCADCSAPSPQWASLLLNEHDGSVEGMGVVVCEQCAVHHMQELGDDRCFLKFLQFSHEWSAPELNILENSGNTMVNEVYEATLDATQGPDPNKQDRFIKKKYKKCRYLDEDKLILALEAIEIRMRKVEAMMTRKSSLEFSSRRGSMQSGRSFGSRRSSLSYGSRRSSVDSYYSGSSTADDISIDESISLHSGSMDTSLSLSMADTLVGSSQFSFDIEDDNEEFFLACARATSSDTDTASSNKDVDAAASDSAPTQAAPTQAAPTQTRIPRKHRRRVSNDSGANYVPTMPLRKGRKDLLRRMLSQASENPTKAGPPLRRTQTSPAPGRSGLATICVSTNSASSRSVSPSRRATRQRRMQNPYRAKAA